MNVSKQVFLLIAILSPSAQAGERSFALPRNTAKAYLLQRAGEALLPGVAPEFTPMNQIDFRRTSFSKGPNPYAQGFAFDVVADIDHRYRCAAQVIVSEKPEVLSFIPTGKTLCHVKLEDEKVAL